ncbi:carboxypeptidase B-like isoform X2 [Daphnia pulex]|uniref:carboxypeptidase B-like isoform X2 n=1 Tax=Daphnia pulex TaxID=6669 RepID=UPI001EDE9658|nr:carboxypeptidase B-like isoform X2 [Daphnia pulex]XP_046642375.1 carboxypeptidase B-like isoform X1 [Daphnia pulicaria]
MSPLLATIIFTCVFAASHTAPQEPLQAWTEDVVSYSGFQLWSATPRNQEEREFLLKIRQDYELEVWKEARSHNSPVDLLVSPDFQTELKLRLADAEIPYEVTISDMQTAINNENPNVTDSGDEYENRKMAGRFKRYLAAFISFFPGHKMDWNSYHRIDDIYGYLNYLADSFPRLVQLVSIGSSFEGRPLYVVRISSSSSGTKPAIWIDGGIHAREWISPAVATYIIKQLVEEPSNERLLQNVDWYIMPVMNPDGYEYTHTSNRLWRKTRSSTGARCRGADPNRNFGYQWGGKGTSRDKCSEIYHGANAFSEPETRAVSNFISGKANQIKVYLTLHSYGQYVLIPWGYDVQYPIDYNDMKDLANKAASKFRRYKYTVGNSADLLYPAAGGSDDWAKSIGIKYSYTVELADTGNHGFVLPASFIRPVCEDFFPALEVFVDKVATLKV